MGPISGSLPITMSKPKPLPSLASIFGKKNEVVSKSWSDLWDEDIEEEEEEADKQLKARQMQNARTWSHESKHDEDDTIRRLQNQRSPNQHFDVPSTTREISPSLKYQCTLACVLHLSCLQLLVGFFLLFFDVLIPEVAPTLGHD